MAAPEQIPTFKLVLVGDGGTGKVRFDIEAVGVGELAVALAVAVALGADAMQLPRLPVN